MTDLESDFDGVAILRAAMAPNSLRYIPSSHPRLAVPSQAQIGGLAHPAPQVPGGAAVPIPASEREARAALARSVLPYAAQVQWGVAL